MKVGNPDRPCATFPVPMEEIVGSLAAYLARKEAQMLSRIPVMEDQ